MKRSQVLLLITPILLLITALFIEGIAKDPLWIDEAYSIDIASTPDIWQRIIDNQVGIHPPLFYFIQRINPWLTDQVFTPRLFSVFVSLLGVALVYRFAKDLFSAQTGIAAALLIGTSDLVISLAPLIRHYNMYMTLSILATWLYWHFQKSGNIRLGVLYSITGVTLLYTMYWGSFILIAHGIHILIFRRRYLIYMLLIGVVVSIAYVPWLPNMITKTSELESGYHSALPVDSHGLSVISYHLIGHPETLLLILAIAGMAGSILGKRWKEYLPNSRTGLLALWIITPILLPIISDLIFNYPLLAHRPMVGLVPAVAMLIAHFMGQLKKNVYIILLFAVIMNSLATTTSSGPLRGPWWDVGDTLAACAAPGDLVIIETHDILHWVTFQRHLLLADVPEDAIFWLPDFIPPIHYHPEALATAAANANHICWLKYWNSTPLDANFLGDFIDTSDDMILAQAGQDDQYNLLDDIVLHQYSRIPTDEPTATFSDLFQMISVTSYQRNDILHVQSLWKTLAPTKEIYSFSAFLLNDMEQLIAQYDSPSPWSSSAYFVDVRSIDISTLEAGSYQLGFQVYDQTVTNLPIQPCDVDVCNTIFLETIEIE